jgi:hypothetical protein
VPWAHAFALLHDDDSVVHAGAWDGSLSLVSLSSGEVVQRVQHHTRPIRCVSLSADGQVLVCGSDDCTVSVWRVALRAGGGGLGGGPVEDMVSADAAARSVGDGMGSGGGAGGGVGGGFSPMGDGLWDDDIGLSLGAGGSFDDGDSDGGRRGEALGAARVESSLTVRGPVGGCFCWAKFLCVKEGGG